MQDYTNIAILSLLERVVERHAPSLLAQPGKAARPRGARADATRKKLLAQHVMDRLGPGLLLAAGQHLELAESTPTSLVLVHSTSPDGLAEKFMRLERYHHASHRTTIEARAGGWCCQRFSLGPPASDAENCLIAGVLFGLLQQIGVKECRLILGEDSFRAKDLRFAKLPAGVDTARFRLHWTQPVRTTGTEHARPVPRGGATVSDRLAGLIETDPGRSWRIADCARHLALSERTLQRLLHAEAHRFSDIVRQVRIREATHYLIDTETSLAEIGYCCGYADQAHFQREFLRMANVTPHAFRQIARRTDDGSASRPVPPKQGRPARPV